LKNQQVTSPALIQFESFEWHYDLMIANRHYRIIEKFGNEELKKEIKVDKSIYNDIPYLQELITKIPKDKLPVCVAVMKYDLKLANNISFARVFPHNF